MSPFFWGLRTGEPSGASYMRPNPVISAISIVPARNQPWSTKGQTSVGETTSMKS